MELDSNSCLSNQTPPPLRCTISLHTGLSGPACFLVCNTLLWPPLSFQPAEVGHGNISFLILLRRVRRLREGTWLSSASRSKSELTAQLAGSPLSGQKHLLSGPHPKPSHTAWVLSLLTKSHPTNQKTVAAISPLPWASRTSSRAASTQHQLGPLAGHSQPCPAQPKTFAPARSRTLVSSGPVYLTPGLGHLQKRTQAAGL